MTTEAAIPDDLLRVKEVAAMLNVGLSSVYTWVQQGLIPACRVGRGTVRIRRSDALKFTIPTNTRAN